VERVYGPIAADIVELALEGKRDDAIKEMNDDCRRHLAALIKASDDYQAFTAGRAEKQLELAADSYLAQRNVLVEGCFAAFAVAALSGVLITRSLTRALGAEPAALGAAAQRVADGGLAPIPGADAARSGSVLASLGAMQSSLAAIVRQVLAASESIATGSAQIATGNADLGQRTEEQASALQQTAATMDDLGATVRNNSDSAKQANQLATGATQVATKGGNVVSPRCRNDEGYQRQQKAHRRDHRRHRWQCLPDKYPRAECRGRGGESGQGRGFAVVAGAVRNLAQRSAAAAEEIKSLITSSVEQVEQGSTLVDEAGRTMDEIIGGDQKCERYRRRDQRS